MSKIPAARVELHEGRIEPERGFAGAWPQLRSIFRRIRERLDLVREVVNTNDEEGATRVRTWMGL